MDTALLLVQLNCALWTSACWISSIYCTLVCETVGSTSHDGLMDQTEVSLQCSVLAPWSFWAMVRCSVSIKLHQYINGKHCEWYLAIFCLQTYLALWVVSVLVRRPTHFPFFFYFSHFNGFLFEVLKRNKTEKATNVIKCTVQKCPFGI
jgi:hypothetical protein